MPETSGKELELAPVSRVLHDTDPLVRRIADRVPSGARVLEFCSGDGELAHLLRGTVAEYRGLDSEPENIRFCWDRFRGPERLLFELVDLSVVHLEPGRRDVVVVTDRASAETCVEDHVRLLARGLRALRPGGLIIVGGRIRSTGSRALRRLEIVRNALGSLGATRVVEEHGPIKSEGIAYVVVAEK